MLADSSKIDFLIDYWEDPVELPSVGMAIYVAQGKSFHVFSKGYLETWQSKNGISIEKITQELVERGYTVISDDPHMKVMQPPGTLFDRWVVEKRGEKILQYNPANKSLGEEQKNGSKTLLHISLFLLAVIVAPMIYLIMSDAGPKSSVGPASSSTPFTDSERAAIRAQTSQRSSANCYSLGLKFGECVARSSRGLSCRAGTDISIPSECRGRADTEAGIKEGAKNGMR